MRPILALVTWGVLLGCSIKSFIVYNQMIDDVNARLQSGDRISPWGWHPGKHAHLMGEYRRLGLPRQRVTTLRVLFAMMTVGMLVLGWMLA